MSAITKKRKRRIAACVTAAIILIIAAAIAVYLNDYYRADSEAIAAFAPTNGISVDRADDGMIVYEPEGADTGLIFYPGGKVEYTAYEPLMEACAAEGVLCVLPEMPFHLAVLDADAADGIQEQYPEIENWYIGGHSLGGAMAASYLADSDGSFEGLILLGSYSSVDLSNAALEVLSIYGSEDLVLNREKYEESRTNLPVGFTEVVLEGGCHAGFGMYGPQEGDGTPAISSEEQIALTAASIADFVNPKGDLQQ